MLALITLLQAIDAKYAKAAAKAGPSQVVVFEEDEIMLDIAAEGLVLENGWTITPFTYPAVSLDYTTINCPPYTKHTPPLTIHVNILAQVGRVKKECIMGPPNNKFYIARHLY